MLARLVSSLCSKSISRVRRLSPSPTNAARRPSCPPAWKPRYKKRCYERKELVNDPRLPISDYNYSALRDRLRKTGVTVSATTITDRAKKLECYKPHRKGKAHDRQVITAAIGALVQRDASLHLWSPFAAEKWTLITSIDDYTTITAASSSLRISSCRKPPGPIFRLRKP
jgi:hypothetical protein